MGVWRNVFRPVVVDRKGLRRYIVSVTLLSWIVALSADVAMQLTFFTSWSACFREWSVTTIVVIAVATPIARSMGRAHLALHIAKEEADRLSRTDPLTGLANRRAFYEAVSQLGGGVLALVIVDIDRFKRINDRYGHSAGDEIIKAVAKRMQEQLGDLGTVARLGGEEFGFVSGDLSGVEIRARLQRFRQRVAEEPVFVGDRPLHTTISIGYAANRALDFDALYAAADTALYVAKSAGRDRVVDYDQIGELAVVASGAPAPTLRAS